MATWATQRQSNGYHRYSKPHQVGRLEWRAEGPPEEKIEREKEEAGRGDEARGPGPRGAREKVENQESEARMMVVSG